MLYINHPEMNAIANIEAPNDEAVASMAGIVKASGMFDDLNWYRAFDADEFCSTAENYDGDCSVLASEIESDGEVFSADPSYAKGACSIDTVEMAETGVFAIQEGGSLSINGLEVTMLDGAPQEILSDGMKVATINSYENWEGDLDIVGCDNTELVLISC